MLSHVGALALYRHVDDFRSAAALHGARSDEAERAYAHLIAAIDGLSDDRGGRTWRRPSIAGDRVSKSVTAQDLVVVDNRRGA